MPQHIAHSGAWGLAIIMIVVASWLFYRYFAPKNWHEWAGAGLVQAFLIALYAEMYGFPLTIYILTGVLGSRYPVLNPFSHASGHLLLTFLGGGAVMMTVIHLVSNGLVIIGFAIMWKGWKLIHGAKGELVTSGPYAYVRHPQYAGLFIIMIGMLIQWPTIITAVMFPVLAFVYYRLSKREEGEMIKLFGDEYKRYMVKTPMFIPKLNVKTKQKVYLNK